MTLGFLCFMAILTHVTSLAEYTTVLVAAQDVGAMESNKFYAFASTTNCWIAQGATPTASAGAGSTFVPAGVVIYLDGGAGAVLSVIRDAADGACSLTPVRVW